MFTRLLGIDNRRNNCFICIKDDTDDDNDGTPDSHDTDDDGDGVPDEDDEDRDTDGDGTPDIGKFYRKSWKNKIVSNL